MIVQTYLAELRAMYDCDRVTISQFHNGEYFAAGASIQKVTLTHYAVKPGVEPVPINPDGHGLLATPATFMPHTLEECFARGYTVCRNFDVKDQWVARYQALNGLRTVVICLIPGRGRGDAVGLLAFGWLDHPEVNEQMIKEFIAHARTSAAYL